MEKLTEDDFQLLYFEEFKKPPLNRGFKTKKYIEWRKIIPNELINYENKTYDNNKIYQFYGKYLKRNGYYQIIEVIAKNKNEAIKIAKKVSKNSIDIYKPMEIIPNEFISLEHYLLRKGYHIWRKQKEN